VQGAVKRRKPKNRLPMGGDVVPRANPASEKAVRKLCDILYRGPLNALAASVMQDLEGFAFGSTQHNSSKVLPSDHMFFAAVAAWAIESHRLTQAQKVRPTWLYI